MTFHRYAQAGFGPDLLPITPPDAPILPHSPCKESLERAKGKVPGKKWPGGWGGFGGWTRVQSQPRDHAEWAAWGAGIGLQGRNFPAIDIDVDDEALAAALHQATVEVLGPAPVRHGRGCRVLLPYRGNGIGKRRLTFRRKGVAIGSLHAVEVLGEGQQYVVEGIHPKTGQPYRWSGDVAMTADALAPVTTELIDVLLERLGRVAEEHGYEPAVPTSAGIRKSGVWQGGLLAPSLQAIGNALAAIPNEVDYDEWIRLLAAVKAAAGHEHEGEALELAMRWSLDWPENTPEQVLDKWASLRPPFSVGWVYLAHRAHEASDGAFLGAFEEFEALEPPPDEGARSGPLLSPAQQRMFDRYVWVEGVKRAVDLETGAMLDREQFNVRHRHIGDPASTKDCAWAVFARDRHNLQTFEHLTFRPGQARFVDERLPGLVGRAVNQWREPDRKRPLPEAGSVADAHVSPWLNHVRFLIPDEAERAVVLDWLAWKAQHPGEKPNYALVIGSSSEGVGKDMMLDPVRVAIGDEYVREVGPGELTSNWTWFVERTVLLIVEEMQSCERKETANRLKPLLAAPPYTLTVNAKHQRQFEVPNILGVIFLTNLDDALSISAQDRRYFVTWSDERPKDASYYATFKAWLDEGGSECVARWLLDRDVSAFSPRGRAPMTAAKENMRRASRSQVDEWVAHGLESGSAPFDDDLVSFDQIYATMRQDHSFRSVKRQKLTNILKAQGVRSVGQVRLPVAVGQGRKETVLVLRGFAEVPDEEVAAEFVRRQSAADVFGAAQ